MSGVVKILLQSIANKLGYRIARISNPDPIIDSDHEFLEIYEKCKAYTMTSKERMYALYKSVEHIVRAGIPGDFVECGVWKGGSAMLIVYALRKLMVTNRKIYLYDTFEGMPEPSADDYRVGGQGSTAIEKFRNNQQDSYNAWCYAPYNQVRNNMSLTLYPAENIIFVKGKVEDTIPHIVPGMIALLRLDTDLYESTKHEFFHLYPLLTQKGILLIDDYGHWAGCKKAVDEYFTDKSILLNRIDYTGRIGQKID